MHSTQGPTRGARAQQNEPTDVLLSNGSIASDPIIAPEPAAPSYYLLSDALPPLLHQLLTYAHTACLLEARSTHVEFGQGAQVAHMHYMLSLHTFLAGITQPILHRTATIASVASRSSTVHGQYPVKVKA